MRLRVKAEASGRGVELTVLANGGAESLKPCLVVIAESLGIQPFHADLYLVEGASSIAVAFLILGSVRLELLDGGGVRFQPWRQIWWFRRPYTSR
ncbi:hypothetical protein KEJ25_06030 [Candidatus Bathyarchaeota archaeon]|nr:hypothetical protein [Candidatus Bathyarchaeota archaeon]